jgi:hypothetical protein
MEHHQPTRWKGLVVGAASGIAGGLAMSAYWQAATMVLGQDLRQMSKQH